MTIIFLLATGNYSGAEKVVVTIINHLKQENRCIYVSPEGIAGHILNSQNIEYISVEKLNYDTVRKLVSELKPDIIHANDFRASIYASLFFQKSRIISHIHCNPKWIKNTNLYSVIYGIVSSRFFKILNVSDAFQNEYKFKNVIKNKCKNIGNPVSLAFIQEQAGCYDEAEKTYDMMYVGRLSEEKNPLEFIEIFYKIWKDNNQVSALMIGDGRLKRECQLLIEKKKIGGQIDMAGFQMNPYQLMKKCRVMVIPSRFEGFGLAAVEALALGKPVVASKVGGLTDIVTEKCGSLCTQEEEFVDAVKKILSDPEEYLLISKEAELQAEKFDNMQLYIQNICNIYDQCMK